MSDTIIDLFTYVLSYLLCLRCAAVSSAIRRRQPREPTRRRLHFQHGGAPVSRLGCASPTRRRPPAHWHQTFAPEKRPHYNDRRRHWSPRWDGSNFHCPTAL